MDRFIKYKRFQEIVNDQELEIFFDALIKGGWEIITYFEEIIKVDIPLYPKIEIKLKITVIAGKKQNI